MQDFEFTDPLTVSVPPMRNDIPDRFWSFIERYCGSIKPDNLKVFLLRLICFYIAAT